MSALITASKIVSSCKPTERRFGRDYAAVQRASKHLAAAQARLHNVQIYGRGDTMKAKRKAAAAVRAAEGVLTAAEQRLNRSSKTFTSCLKKASKQ